MQSSIVVLERLRLQRFSTSTIADDGCLFQTTVDPPTNFLIRPERSWQLYQFTIWQLKTTVLFDKRWTILSVCWGGGVCVRGCRGWMLVWHASIICDKILVSIFVGGAYWFLRIYFWNGTLSRKGCYKLMIREHEGGDFLPHCININSNIQQPIMGNHLGYRLR